jgi:hypothetical protein
VITTARRTVASSPLVAAGGLLVTRLADQGMLDALASEVVARHSEAGRAEVPEPPHDGEQRGQPDRRVSTAVGGPILAQFFTSRATLTVLATLTGVVCEPLGDQGTYSFYGPGDFLGVHRDAPNCDVAVITCLYDDGQPGVGGGELVVYPGRAADTMASLRADPQRGAHPVRLAPGDSALLLGGTVPHHVMPIGPGRLRVVAPLCYRAHW